MDYKKTTIQQQKHNSSPIHSAPMKYSDKITILLNNRGLSVRDFAKGLNKDPGNTHSLLKGDVDPHPTTKRKVADYFGMTVEEIFNPLVPLPPRADQKDASEAWLREAMEALDSENLAGMAKDTDNVVASRLMAQLILAEREILRLNKIIDKLAEPPAVATAKNPQTSLRVRPGAIVTRGKGENAKSG